MRELLLKLYENKIDLSLLLLEAKNFTEEIDDAEFTEFIEKETNGYKIEQGLPKYREIRGELVVDIKNIYGEQTHKEYPVDFSLLSEKVGLDLELAFIPDGISFVELSIKGLTGKNAIKPIPKQIVKMLDETFHYNNPSMHLTGAFHKIPTATLEFILVKVRQILIEKLQEYTKKQSKSNKLEEGIVVEKMKAYEETQPTKVFVSYAWEDNQHNDRIISFVNFLRENGFDASMDRKESQEESAVNFNKLMFDGIQNSDKVVIILSKKYKTRADKFEGGVWQELNLIIEDIKRNPKKYIFVSFGFEGRNEITPTAIGGLDVLDLKKDQDENEFNILFSKLQEENVIIFSDVNSKVIEIKKKETKPFKL